jgi:hypothetical protein
MGPTPSDAHPPWKEANETKRPAKSFMFMEDSWGVRHAGAVVPASRARVVEGIAGGARASIARSGPAPQRRGQRSDLAPRARPVGARTHTHAGLRSSLGVRGYGPGRAAAREPRRPRQHDDASPRHPSGVPRTRRCPGGASLQGCLNETSPWWREPPRLPERDDAMVARACRARGPWRRHALRPWCRRATASRAPPTEVAADAEHVRGSVRPRDPAGAQRRVSLR